MTNALHDRWPYISLSVGLAGVAAALVNRQWFRGHEAWFFFLWLHLPFFMFHQFEEYAVPGGFGVWWNRVVFKSRNPEFPLSKKLAMRINFPGLYVGFSILALLGIYVAPWIGMLALFATMANAYFHISYAIATRSYVPGVVTSLLLYLPLTGWAAYHFARNGEISLAGFALAWAGGLALNVPVFRQGWSIVDRHPERLEKVE